MTYFILSIISSTFVFFFYFVKSKNWYHLFYFFLTVTIMIILYIYTIKNLPYSYRGIGTEWDYKGIVLFLSMLAGMVTNTISNQIRGKKFNIRLADLVKTLSVAPIIFSFVWGAIEKMLVFNFITVCFAYTNGYFWETILKRVSREINQGNYK